MGWGMRGDKVGRVMTTLAWGGRGAGLSAFWAPVPAVPCCCPWCPAEAAVAMAAACWEIWCMMFCMNSGGSPGTWMGAVVPSENRHTELSEKWLLKLLEIETAARSEFCTQDYKQLTNNSCVTSQCKNSTLTPLKWTILSSFTHTTFMTCFLTLNTKKGILNNVQSSVDIIN